MDRDLDFLTSEKKELNTSLNVFKFMEYLHPALKDAVAKFVVDGSAQFLSRQINVPVQEFKNRRKGRAKDFSVLSGSFLLQFY